jgi:hypothetical protein
MHHCSIEETMTTAIITLTDEQVASVIAQAGGQPIPPDPIPPDPIPPSGNFRLIVVPWAGPFSWISQNEGGFQCQDVIVFMVTTPVVPWKNRARFTVSEYGNPPVTRQMMLSRVAGSFEMSDAITQSQGTNVSLSISPYLVLPGTTCYLNLRNYSTDLGHQSCPTGTSCNIIANLSPGS